MKTQDYVIYFDIDGTLIDHRTHTLPKTAIQALHQLKRSGYLLCIATGRRMASIQSEVLHAVEWDGFVCTNGQTVYDEDKRLISNITLQPKTVRECIALAQETNTSIEIKTADEHFLINDYSDAMRKAYDYFHIPLPKQINKYTNLDINTLMVYREAERDYRDFSRIDGIDIYPGVDCYADITHANYSKADGIEVSLSQLNKTKYIAIGDSMNDFTMLEHADIAIAMGNSESQLKHMSDYITAPVHKDGISECAKWILRQLQFKY